MRKSKTLILFNVFLVHAEDKEKAIAYIYPFTSNFGLLPDGVSNVYTCYLCSNFHISCRFPVLFSQSLPFQVNLISLFISEQTWFRTFENILSVSLFYFFCETRIFLSIFFQDRSSVE